MKLINIKSGKPLVEFKENETVFYNKYLEKEMKRLGVNIPHGMRGLFEGKDLILLGDALFQDAFKEVYYLTYMNHEIFKWQE